MDTFYFKTAPLYPPPLEYGWRWFSSTLLPIATLIAIPINPIGQLGQAAIALGLWVAVLAVSAVLWQISGRYTGRPFVSRDEHQQMEYQRPWLAQFFGDDLPFCVMFALAIAQIDIGGPFWGAGLKEWIDALGSAGAMALALSLGRRISRRVLGGNAY